MKKTIEISASFTGTISTGSYENEKPFYSIKEILEGEEVDGMSEDTITDRQKKLHDICRRQFKRQADASYAEKIANTYRNIRFYDGKDGRKYPSVTSIISWDEDFYIAPDVMAQYAARGTIIHKQCEIFLKEKIWKGPKELPEIYPDFITVTKGSLGLSLDDVNFVGFYKDYPFKVISLESTVLNHQHQYGGRIDIKCLIEKNNPGKWDKIEGIKFDVPTILDVKTGSLDKTYGFKQQTAYAKCDPDVQQIGLIHLNNEVKAGFSKPIIETNLDKYWSLFLKDRSNFYDRYKI